LKSALHDGCMDLIAIAIAVAFFALMALLIEGIERV
jgi:hypothetical protein